MLCTAILYYFITYSSVIVRCTDNRYTHVNKPVQSLPCCPFCLTRETRRRQQRAPSTSSEVSTPWAGLLWVASPVLNNHLFYEHFWQSSTVHHRANVITSCKCRQNYRRLDFKQKYKRLCKEFRVPGERLPKPCVEWCYSGVCTEIMSLQPWGGGFLLLNKRFSRVSCRHATFKVFQSRKRENPKTAKTRETVCTVLIWVHALQFSSHERQYVLNFNHRHIF